MEQPPAIKAVLSYIWLVPEDFRSWSPALSASSAAIPKMGPEDFHWPFMACLQISTVSRELAAVINMERGRTSFSIVFSYVFGYVSIDIEVLGIRATSVSLPEGAWVFTGWTSLGLTHHRYLIRIC